MSKDLRKDAERLEREADRRAETIRQVVHQYNLSEQNGAASHIKQRLDMQRELERVVEEYFRIHKSLKRLRKKMQV